jgi:DNA-binding transcriptional LysR family regulator
LVSAATLGLTQPAPGDAIRRLEVRLAVRLLERGPQGVAPTAAGDAFDPPAPAARWTGWARWPATLHGG